MKKRGVSKIITTVLLILMALVLMIIAWSLIAMFLKGETESIGLRNRLMDENLDIRSIDTEDPSMIDITLSKGAGKSIYLGENTSEVNYTVIEVVFYNETVEVIYTIWHNETNVTWYSVTNITYYNVTNITFYNESVPIDVVSVVDLSGSMSGTKISEAKSSTISFINAVLNNSGSMVGLVGYRDSVSDSDSHVLSNDSVSLINEVDSWSAGGYTCICCGIERAITYLQSSTSSTKVILVMSDGYANRVTTCSGSGSAAQQSIQAAQDAYDNYGITVHTIGFGSSVDESTLQAIANAGNGNYYYSDVGELETLYTEVILSNITVTFEVENTTITWYNETTIIWYNETVVEWVNETRYNRTESIVSTNITIQQYGSELAYDYLLITLYNDTSSYNYKLTSTEVPSPHETTTISISLVDPVTGQYYITDITKIEIRAIIIDEDGGEIIGPILDVWYAG